MLQNVRPSLSSDYEWSRWRDIHNTYIHNIHIHINVHKQYNKQHTYIDVYSTRKSFKMRVEFSVHYNTLQYITLFYNTSHCTYLFKHRSVCQTRPSTSLCSFIVILHRFIYNRTENSDAHFGTFLMQTIQAPINNLHRKHRHQSSSITIHHHPSLNF